MVAIQAGQRFHGPWVGHPFSIHHEAVFVSPRRQEEFFDPPAISQRDHPGRAGPPIIERPGDVHLTRLRMKKLQPDLLRMERMPAETLMHPLVPILSFATEQRAPHRHAERGVARILGCGVEQVHNHVLDTPPRCASLCFRSCARRIPQTPSAIFVRASLRVSGCAWPDEPMGARCLDRGAALICAAGSAISACRFGFFIR